MLSELSTEDNAWLYLASPAQLHAQVEPLLAEGSLKEVQANEQVIDVYLGR